MEDRSQLRALVDQARRGGARACEVLRCQSEERVMTAWRGRPQRSEVTTFTVRAWLDGGRGGVGRGPSGDRAVADALAAAAQAESSAVAGPADRMPAVTGPLGIDDRRHAGIAELDRNEVLQTAERALSQGGVALHRIEYRERREVRAYLSTREIELEAGSTAYALEAEASLAGRTLRHRIASRHFSDVASLPFGTDLRRRLESLVPPGPVPSRLLPVVLDPRAMAALVRGIAPAFAATVIDRSFLGAFRGKALASPALHLTDDAGLASGLRTRTFDDRGVPPIAVALLKEGVVNSLYHDPESARALGLRPTGHCGPDGLAPANLVVRPGSRTRNVILTELKDYVVVDELPPVDLATGRLEGVVDALLVAGGQRVAGFRALIATDIHTLLHQVSELAADQERSEEVDAPTTVFEGLALEA
ncbi:MAG: hypothetical protein FJ102_00985 [Deltaproteobacteria bacterium]|nr:hypothetical protein [Deltaproteobacteria bacterium]